MTYRLLHLSDLHLDRSFGTIGCDGRLAQRRRLGLRDALRAAGAAAQAHGCDAVAIGGDLYEHERAGVDTERFLIDTFASWQPMRVLLVPGNHDPLVSGSIHGRAAWPANVTLFTSTSLTPVELADGLAVWGLAHREPAWRGDPLAVAALPRDGVHVALFHGSEISSLPEGKEAHAPFHGTRIREAGFAVALCGHYHARRHDPAWGLCYPGTPEPLSFDETGRRGPVLVDIGSDATVAITPLDLNRWTAAVAEADLSGVRSSTGLLDAVQLACTGAAGGLDPDTASVRVDLTGELEPAAAIDVTLLETALRDTCGIAHVRVRDRTRPRLEHSAEDAHSARAAFVRAAQQLRAGAASDDEAALADDALRYGLAALAGAEVGLR